MSTAARSLFTEAIEEHLALKKQNTGLETAMPLARYDLGDPLERYPGGPNRGVDATQVVAVDEAGATVPADASVQEPVTAATPTPPADLSGQDTQLFVGPSPEQAMEAATTLEPAFADRPFEPLSGMTPLLSLVEDIEDEDDATLLSTGAQPAPAPVADVLRFPGGVGPREGAQLAEVLATDMNGPDGTGAAGSSVRNAMDAAAATAEAPTGEQPVIVIDADEPLAGAPPHTEPPTASRAGQSRRKPRFFGRGRKGKQQSDAPSDGWFTDGPRDFNWD